MHLPRALPPRTLLSLSLPALFSTMASPTSSSANPTPPTYPSFGYHPRHPSFPYSARDFQRQDETPDTDFYAAPRFVTHIDDHAIAALSAYYAQHLPPTGRVLDFCSSWVSHFPTELVARAVATVRGERGEKEEALEVVGMGINERELAANPILAQRILRDLNAQPDIPAEVGALDAATCVVSIDYLVHPREVLESLRARVKQGGTVHLVVSNRCFPTKAVGRWLRVGEQEKLLMVGDYLHWSGWREVEVVTVCDGKGEGGGWFGMGREDPLWVVRGRNVDG
ncbi:hypothetical protein MMC34_006173 [Xylographa carneopallida]|nr:hypothetical protein [Xylographa carneopallida]